MFTDLEVQKQISETVRRELKRRKWSIYKLYKESQIPKSSLYSLLDNKSEWSLEYAMRVSTILGISLESLMFASENSINKELVIKYEALQEEVLILREKVATYEAVVDFEKIKNLKKLK